MNTIKKNKFKQSLIDKQTQIGLWVGLANPYTTEIIASHSRFDWLLIDGEHGPNSIQSILAQLQVLNAYPVTPIVRPPIGDPVLIKQYLDLGAQTLLIPMVENAAQATDLVRAMRYPPEGIRGVGSALARASLWNSVEDYLNTCNDEMCLLVQIENAAGLNELPAIAQVPGVDGVFIGPADMSASLGYRGNPQHPHVQQKIDEALSIIKKAGKAAGILYAHAEKAEAYITMGFDFVAVGVDTSLLAKSCQDLAHRFQRSLKPDSRTVPDNHPSVY